MDSFAFLCLRVATLLAPLAGLAQQPADAKRRNEPMVDVSLACPGVVIELRYATPRNVTGACIYSPDSRCYLRQSVAARLNRVQQSLSERGARLKIWDAYRPAWAQAILWRAIQNPEVIGDPVKGGSFHTRGVSVDVTLVDRYGRELRMPTDFDDFSASASSRYRGSDPVVARNLKLLQSAMGRAGFIKMQDEWWHFTAQDANDFTPLEMKLNSALRPAGACYWATSNGTEVDPLLFKNGRRVGIECKPADAPALTPSIRSLGPT